MENNLSTIIINELVDKCDIDQLFYLLESNIITNVNKKLINLKILSNISLIIKLIENNDLLKKYLYKNELLIIYYLLFNYNEDKLDIYIKNMISYNNFDENDSSFLLYLLYNVNENYVNNNSNNIYLYNKKQKYILNKFIYTDDSHKLTGFLTLLKFNFDVRDYIRLWVNTYTYNNYNYDFNNVSLKLKICVNMNDFILINLYKNRNLYNFNINLIFTSQQYIINTTGIINISNTDKYYTIIKIKTCWYIRNNNSLDYVKEIKYLNKYIKENIYNNKIFIKGKGINIKKIMRVGDRSILQSKINNFKKEKNIKD